QPAVTHHRFGRAIGGLHVGAWRGQTVRQRNRALPETNLPCHSCSPYLTGAAAVNGGSVTSLTAPLTVYCAVSNENGSPARKGRSLYRHPVEVRSIGTRTTASITRALPPMGGVGPASAADTARAAPSDTMTAACPSANALALVSTSPAFILAAISWVATKRTRASTVAGAVATCTSSI